MSKKVDEVDRVFSAIPNGDGTYNFRGASSMYDKGRLKRWNGNAWVEMGGGS
jgi:hypothetical protein